MRVECYDSRSQVVKDKSRQHELFFISQVSFYEMLSLPIGQDKIDEEEMEKLFNSLQIEQKKAFLTELLPKSKDNQT